MRARSVVAVALLLAACRGGRSEASQYAVATGGDPARGAATIGAMGCGSCHTVPGVRGAHGVVGPPLMFFSKRSYIAGVVPNTPENLIQWVKDPRSIDSLTAMPKILLSDQQARDIAAYLYTLR